MYSLDNNPRGRINPGPLLGGVIIAQGAGLIPAPYWNLSIGGATEQEESLFAGFEKIKDCKVGIDSQLSPFFFKGFP